MLSYQFSLKAPPTVQFQDFAGVICLVYFTICVNAAAKKFSCCQEVLQKLNKLECPKPGTL